MQQYPFLTWTTLKTCHTGCDFECVKSETEGGGIGGSPGPPPILKKIKLKLKLKLKLAGEKKKTIFSPPIEGEEGWSPMANSGSVLCKIKRQQKMLPRDIFTTIKERI
jgi:hypothetical protein